MKGLLIILKISLVYSIAFSIISSFALGAEPEERLSAPKTERKSLLNGMQMMFFDGNPEETPFVLMVKNGAAFDPLDKWGATYLMARMLLDPLSESLTAEELERKGIQISSRVDWDAIYFTGSAPVAELEGFLAQLSDLLVRPDFQEDSFQRLRNELLDEIKRTQDRPERATQSMFLSHVFEDGPYAHSVKGTEETLQNLFLRDIKIQYRRLLMPNQAILGLPYNGDRTAFFSRLSGRWGSWVRKESAPFTFKQSPKPEKATVVISDTPGSDVTLMRWGFLGVNRASRDFFTFKILEQYLTLSLPDWANEISSSRQIRGSARLVARQMPGYLQVSLEAPAEHISHYLRQLSGCIEGLQKGDINQVRFDEAKRLAFLEYAEALNDPSERIRQVLEADLYGLGMNYMATYKLRLDRVIPEVFQRTLQTEVQANAYTAAISGPADRLKSDLSEFAEVQVLQ